MEQNIQIYYNNIIYFTENDLNTIAEYYFTDLLYYFLQNGFNPQFSIEDQKNKLSTMINFFVLNPNKTIESIELFSNVINLFNNNQLHHKNFNDFFFESFILSLNVISININELLNQLKQISDFYLNIITNYFQIIYFVSFYSNVFSDNFFGNQPNYILSTIENILCELFNMQEKEFIIIQCLLIVSQFNNLNQKMIDIIRISFQTVSNQLKNIIANMEYQEQNKQYFMDRFDEYIQIALFLNIPIKDIEFKTYRFKEFQEIFNECVIKKLYSNLYNQLQMNISFSYNQEKGNEIKTLVNDLLDHLDDNQYRNLLQKKEIITILSLYKRLLDEKGLFIDVKLFERILEKHVEMRITLNQIENNEEISLANLSSLFIVDNHGRKEFNMRFSENGKLLFIHFIRIHQEIISQEQMNSIFDNINEITIDSIQESTQILLHLISLMTDYEKKNEIINVIRNTIIQLYQS